MQEFQHQPVLLKQVIEYLAIKPAGVYVDATIGGAGHAARIAAVLDRQGLLIGLDQDQAAIAVAAERLQNVKPQIKLVKSNFSFLGKVLAELEVASVDGILFDLGVSSPQLDLEERGFSYRNDTALDMRMDQTQPFSAAHLVNTASVEELAKILWEFGEERWSKRIALFIDKQRRERPIETTGELTAIIKQAIPAAARRAGPHPARRTFQALRIAVNHELEAFETALDQAIALLKPGGRVVVISFHSLEDRLVKKMFNKWCEVCICPKYMPVCQCHQTRLAQLITRKPVSPSQEETLQNRRARSAKLRCAEKLGLGMQEGE